MSRAWVQSLVQEDPTCGRATEHVYHSYWAHALQQGSHCNEKPAQHNYRVAPADHNRRNPRQQQRPSATKDKQKPNQENMSTVNLWNTLQLNQNPDLKKQIL